MSPRQPTALVLFPGALGDLLCCWPALDGLIAAGWTVTVASRVDLRDILPPDGPRQQWLERREISDLFAPAPLAPATAAYFGGFDRIESFTGAAQPGFADRLTEAAGRAVGVHAFRGMRSGESAVDYYARCLGVAPCWRTLPIPAEATAWAEALWQRHRLGTRVLALHPGSGAVRKNWQGMSELAAEWRRSGGAVVAILGPAEIERQTAMAADVVIAGEPLARVAAVLQRADRYVGNDSGISHLAGRLGVHAVVLFADTDPAVWKPAGPRVCVLRAEPACAVCGPRQFCIHRLPVARVHGVVSEPNSTVAITPDGA